jgi:CheY-like chemotaxis protein
LQRELGGFTNAMQRPTFVGGLSRTTKTHKSLRRTNFIAPQPHPFASQPLRPGTCRRPSAALPARRACASFASRQARDFDVMIIDIFMPSMRGFESVRMFHQRAPDVPLIAISGYPNGRPGIART